VTTRRNVIVHIAISGDGFVLVPVRRGSWYFPLYVGWMCYALPALRPLAAQTDTSRVTISGTVVGVTEIDCQYRAATTAGTDPRSLVFDHL
jgi:hypothetical protein